MNKKKKEDYEYILEIEMGSHINLEQKIHTLSLMNACPDCGYRLNEFDSRCNYCGYVEFKKLFSGIII